MITVYISITNLVELFPVFQDAIQVSIIIFSVCTHGEQAVWEAATICPPPRASGDMWIRHKLHVHVGLTWTANQSGLVTLTFDLLSLNVVSESRVTWATSVPILVFIGLSVFDLGPMYATDVRRRQTSDAHHRLMLLPVGAGAYITQWNAILRAQCYG